MHSTIARTHCHCHVSAVILKWNTLVEPVATASTHAVLHSAALGDLNVLRNRRRIGNGHLVSLVPQRGTACSQTFELLHH